MKATLKLPRTIDEPPMMLFWRGDELVPFFLLFVIGFIIKQLLISIFLGIVMVKVVRKYRDIRPDGYVIHTLWWKGIYPIMTRTTGNPFLRKFVNYRMVSQLK